MKEKLKEHRVKLKKFNNWEIDYSKNLSVQNNVEQFEELFNLAYKLPEDIKEKGHNDHLNNLIAIKKRFRIKGNI